MRDGIQRFSLIEAIVNNDYNSGTITGKTRVFADAEAFADAILSADSRDDADSPVDAGADSNETFVRGNAAADRCRPEIRSFSSPTSPNK